MTCWAHSAPPHDPARGPQPYGEHARAVWSGATKSAEAIFTFARGPAADFVVAMRTAIAGASAFHDLGKLDARNQAVLEAGRNGRLPPECDHMEAGIAHALAEPHRNLAAAWLIRAHHSPPGLPDRANEKFMPFGPLRGARKREDSTAAFHKPIVERTNRGLPIFLARHFEAWPDSPEIVPGAEIHGMPLRLALSCLVDADHLDTAAWDGACALPEATVGEWSTLLRRLDRYVSRLEKRDAARDCMRSALYEHAGAADLSPALLACEAGVGMGKTTTVLRWLLRKAEALSLRKLVIVAPYTNILRQTARTLREAFCRTDEEASSWISENHHRAEFADQSARQYAATWRAPIVLTTAVQFFETLASNRPAALRKLHRLAGSAIFIDEAHAALPPSHWAQAWEWLIELAEQWSCPTVLASGSMFRFWEERELHAAIRKLPDLTPPDLQQASHEAEPQRLRFDTLHSLSVDDLCRRLLHDLEQAEGPSLCILNTVQTAAVIACRLAKRLDGIDPLSEHSRRPLRQRKVLHLSTALTPTDRELVLSEIERRTRERTSGWILVATSCVEAGVDLDFQCGYRERCSVSAYLQTSGRVNRHGQRKGASLFDFQLIADPSITLHPQFKISRAVFEQLWPAITSNSQTPAELVSLALRLEFDRTGGFSETLRKLEHENNYPEVALEGRVIASDSRTVIVDSTLAKRAKAGLPIQLSILLRNSVQIWSKKLDQLGMEPVRTGSDLYIWKAQYDPQLIGIMQGILPSVLGTVAPGVLLVENIE